MFSRLLSASMDPVWTVLFVSFPISGASFYKRRKVPKHRSMPGIVSFLDSENGSIAELLVSGETELYTSY